MRVAGRLGAAMAIGVEAMDEERPTEHEHDHADAPAAEPSPGLLAIWPLADSALLVVLGDRIDPAINARALALAAALEGAAVAGVSDIVPSYATVLVAFDPVVADGEALAEVIRSHAAGLTRAAPPPGRDVAIPVRYGGLAGPDLADVATHAGLSADEVVRLHAGAEYRVACMGFCPGFAYLLGLPDALRVPRRATPRTRVPAGSVAIGGAQTGVYPLATPGGWNVIGHADVALFDPARAEPILLEPGDRVRFVPVDEDAFPARPDDRPRAGASDGPATTTATDATGVAIPAFASAPGAIHLREPARTLDVLSAGGVATVQDLGRPGLMRLGVTPGGALDRRALVLGNRLLGNDPGAAALECALAGPALRFGRDTLFAVTGADFGPRLDGSDISPWTPIMAPAGSVLSFAHPARPGAGVRCFVCVEGGIAVAPVMGSRATDLFGGFGGLDGRPLRAGDVLPLGPALPAAEREDALRRRLAGSPPEPVGHGPLRVVLGPQAEQFAGDGLAAFLAGRYVVGPRSDRMGLRLAGPPIVAPPGPDMVSEGIAPGAIQVPPDGQPIVLLPARQTVGGYPKIATVVGADLDRLGQLGPGDAVRFAAVDLATARDLTRAARVALGPDAVRVLPRAVVLAPGLAAEALGWEEPALRRVAEDARSAGLTGVAVDAPGLRARIACARPLPPAGFGGGA